MSGKAVAASFKGDLESDGESPHGRDQSQEAPHYWEDDTFSGETVPEELRQHLQYSGVPKSFSAKPDEPPLLLAGVRGLDRSGSPFHWLARRHRKGVAQEHLCPTPAPPISWFGWLNVRQHYRKPGWWVALLFTVGSAVFIMSGVASEIRPVARPDDPTPGLRSLSAALIGWPNAIAANLLFFPAGLLQLWEATHMDFKPRMKAWEARGRRGPRPTHHILPTRADLRTVSFWAVVLQLSGMVGFNLATHVELIGAAVELQPSVVDWCQNFGFTYGSAAFTVSSVLFCLEATGSWWRGLLPTCRSDLRKLSWHTAFWAFYGSVGFLIGSAGTYATSFSWTQKQWINGFGGLAGAVYFLLSSLAAMLEQANPNHP